MGFNTVVGFGFAFIIIFGVFGVAFLTVTKTFSDNIALLEYTQSTMEKSKSSLFLRNVYVDSGRLKIEVVNNGFSNYFFKDGENLCLDIIIDGEYINRDNIDFFFKTPRGNYKILKPGEVGIVELSGNYTNDDNFNVLFISCNGVRYEVLIDSDKYDWYDLDYARKSTFTIFNPSSLDVESFFYVLSINGTDVDFSKANENNLSMISDLSNQLVLDLNFDEYSQELEDFSKYTQTVFLGSTSSVEISDPVEVDGVYFGGLNFDGSSNYLRIIGDLSLMVEKQKTISVWVDWNGEGDEIQTIFSNGADSNSLSILNDSRVQFTLNISGILRTLNSNLTVGSEWNHISAVYDGEFMRVYINGMLSGELAVLGDINSVSSDNYVGRSISNMNFYNGSIDELKVYNIGLNDEEIKLLYSGRVPFRVIDFTVDYWDSNLQEANLSFEIPFMFGDDFAVVDLYYYLRSTIEKEEDEFTPPTPPTGPDQINDLSSTPGNGEVNLIWSPPPQGDNSIVEYVVQYGLVSSGVFNYTYSSGSSTSAIISGLENNVDWQFRVYAVDSVGITGPTSNVVTETPTGRYWITSDTTTNLGFDGTANQGINAVTYAQLLFGSVSPSTSACVQRRISNGEFEIANQYTSVFASQTEISANSLASLTVDGQFASVIWRAFLYEYNDISGNVRQLGFAQNTTLTNNFELLNFQFNNTQFNVSSGNRLKIQMTAELSGNNRWVYLCYGSGTQSYYEFNRVIS